MSKCFCMFRCLRKFLVCFWSVFWVLTFIFNAIGLGQFWGWIGGQAFRVNFDAVNHSINMVHRYNFLPSFLFVISFFLQLYTAYLFVKSLMHVCKCGEVAKCCDQSMAMGVVMLLLFYGLQLLVVALGAPGFHYAINVVPLAILQLLSLKYLMHAKHCN